MLKKEKFNNSVFLAAFSCSERSFYECFIEENDRSKTKKKGNYI